MSQVFAYFLCIGVTLGLQLSGFAHAYTYQTERFYDIMGGLNFFAVTACSAFFGESPWVDDPRKVVNTGEFVGTFTAHRL